MSLSSSTTSTYKDLAEFLAKHKQDKNITTHTRIPDKELSIYGGAYHIPKEELQTFMNLYHQHVFVKRKMEFLTEKQNEESGPCLVDFDFRYEHDVETKQHTDGGVQDMLYLYLDELKKLLVFEENKPFMLYVMEKPNVNRLQDGSLTKDGIHMVIGIDMDRTLQIMLRERIVETIPDVWNEMPLINTWDKVLDEGISKGTTNWQMYGSRKPGNEAYQITKIFKISFDEADSEFMMEEESVKDFDFSRNLIQLSAQYEGNPKFDINPKIVDDYNSRRSSKAKRPAPVTSRPRLRLLEEEENEDEVVSLEGIDTAAKLQSAIDSIMKELKPSEYFVRETHEYTQILPAKYYEPGSHLLNRQVAFALKRTDERLFLSWVQLRSKASDFSFDTIPELFQVWKRHFNTKTNTDGITRKSILYWAKQDAHEDYIKVKKSTVDNYIEETIHTCTEFDCAMVLYNMFKDMYVCSDTKSSTWWVFRNHRWYPDKGNSLRLAISREMYNVYQEKVDACSNEIQQYESTDDRYEFIKKKMTTITTVSLKFKKTADKNNIMREATDIFYDPDFTSNVDSNPYLLCFTNGIIDFRNNSFRDGIPQDYITKCTGIPYVPFDETLTEMMQTKDEIIQFMEQLFPVEELNRYMWDHFASCLIGVNLNQTFPVYRGSGSNGKSMLIELMSLTLGQYKGTVPINLVTDKRTNIGSTSSEVVALKGLRYAVMQEPSKDSRINEGMMKELTGGDPIQARALYSECVTFIPQFKLIACTNTLFEINSNDDGTWRRIRLCDFMSKFVDENETYTDNTPYIFPKDKDLQKKLPRWAPVFASMLIKLAFQTGGKVEDCDIVKASTNKYRQGQDHISAFVDEIVIKTGLGTDKIRKNELTNEFKLWFQNSQGTRKMPKGVELYDYMDKKFGKCRSTGWHGVKLVEPDYVDDVDDI